jgi:hypothetical protein
LVGIWEGEGRKAGRHIHNTVRIDADGSLTSTTKTEDGETQTLIFHYTYADGMLTLSREGGVEESGALVRLGADRFQYDSPWFGREVFTRTGD